MTDLISRQALCEYALNQKDKSIMPNDIMRFPSAQPENARKNARKRMRAIISTGKMRLMLITSIAINIQMPDFQYGH